MTSDNRVNRYFVMADGHKIRLVVSRFDERQRRLHLRLPASATCWDYAPLIDVMQREAGFEVDRFTGRSAAQWLAELRDRSSPDFERFRIWYEVAIHRLLDSLSRRPRVPDNHYCTELAAPPLTSSLPERISALGLKRASAEQWSATLRALTGKGVKQEELDMSGVLIRLFRSPADAVLSCEQILAMVDLAHVLPRFVCESRFGYEATAGWDERCSRIPEKEFKKRGLPGKGYGAVHLVRFRHRSLGWSIVRTRYLDLITERRDWWCVLDERGRAIQQAVFDLASRDEAIAFADRKIRETFARWGNDRALAKWERFALPGGDAYREILLQLDDWPGSYAPRHFRTRNVLVHLRTSIRTTLGGQRVLFVDEIQSDWHADLHAKPQGTIADAPLRKEWPLLAMKLMLWWAQRMGADGLAWSTAELQLERWRGFGPPEGLYRKTLPDAAQTLAKVLDLALATTRLSVRQNSRRVVLGKKGWEVRNRKNEPLTKPFKNREQAERFADLTGGFSEINVPVLWIMNLGRIQSIPLYGTGSAATWLTPEIKPVAKAAKPTSKARIPANVF